MKSSRNPSHIVNGSSRYHNAGHSSRGILRSAGVGGGEKSLHSLIFMIVMCGASFFAGTLWSLQSGVQSMEHCSDQMNVAGSISSGLSPAKLEELVNQKVKQTLALMKKEEEKEKSSASSGQKRFPDSVSRYATGMAKISKLDFAEFFEMGVPLDVPKRNGDQDVLILYNNPNSHPESPSKAQQKAIESMVEIPSLTPQIATENCQEFHIVLNDQSGRHQCLAIVPQYESFHIQKWLRVSPDGGPLDPKQALRYVSRGYQHNGREKFRAPKERHTRRLWALLAPYFTSIDNVLKKLKVVCRRVAKNNQVIVMVCNKGQSELLMNFVCSIRARGLDTSQILVFATDEETKDLAEGMGLAAFFDETNFGSMPSEAAKGYGDRKFVAMMLAKVFCVQMVAMLGYDILFQDVDIVWYSNPLDYFNARKDGFDIYFQDDGAHSTRYAPYSANSGFYFVRHNDRTKFFLTSLLHQGDLVISTDSHQQALIALLAEHSSLYGLRVKVLSRDMDEFPGGYQFHQRSGKFMHGFFSGTIHPVIFHMSWTLNKDNKLLYFRQMGEWYLQDTCIQKTVSEIGATTSLPEHCCAAEPLLSCHYRDKPSKNPCPNSPSIDKNKPSWWSKF